MTHRISPATAPFAPEIQAAFDKIMPPGQPPLALFTTLARDPRLFSKFFASSLLDRGHLTLRQRELVINRTTALCKSEYESRSSPPKRNLTKLRLPRSCMAVLLTAAGQTMTASCCVCATPYTSSATSRMICGCSYATSSVRKRCWNY